MYFWYACFKSLIQLEIIKKEKGDDTIPIIEENKPFKNREDVKAEIRNCDLFGGICQYACFGFAALGVIGDALNITLGLEPMSWFLLAIVAGLNALIGHMHVVVAKHLLGTEVKNKQE